MEKYQTNLQEILNFANIINSVDTDALEETNGTSSNVNVFREDEISEFKNIEGIMQNAPEKTKNMFKIPKVI